jgi:hypothetical protein
VARVGHTITSKAVVALDGDSPYPLTPERFDYAKKSAGSAGEKHSGLEAITAYCNEPDNSVESVEKESHSQAICARVGHFKISKILTIRPKNKTLARSQGERAGAVRMPWRQMYLVSQRWKGKESKVWIRQN